MQTMSSARRRRASHNYPNYISWCCWLCWLATALVVQPTEAAAVAVLPSRSSSGNSISNSILQWTNDVWNSIYQRRPPVVARVRTTHFDRLIEKAFDSADVNKDGRIHFDECYALVMKLYVYLNRQAPVPPPTRPALRKLFAESDVNQSNCISRTEFRALARRLGKRAFFRVAACQAVRIVGAPLLASAVVRTCQHHAWPPERIVTKCVPKFARPRVLPMVNNPNVWRSVLVVGLVATLGNVVVGGVNWVLHHNLFPGEEEEMYD